MAQGLRVQEGLEPAHAQDGQYWSLQAAQVWGDQEGPEGPQEDGCQV